jgi:hypothetical protein
VAAVAKSASYACKLCSVLTRFTLVIA